MVRPATVLRVSRTRGAYRVMPERTMGSVAGLGPAQTTSIAGARWIAPAATARS